MPPHFSLDAAVIEPPLPPQDAPSAQRAARRQRPGTNEQGAHLHGARECGWLKDGRLLLYLVRHDPRTSGRPAAVRRRASTRRDGAPAGRQPAHAHRCGQVPCPHPASCGGRPGRCVWPARTASRSATSRSSRARTASPWRRPEFLRCLATSQSAPGRTRTCDPLLRRQPLYPLSYRGMTPRYRRGYRRTTRPGQAR